MNKNEDRDLQESYEWIYNNWGTFAFIMTIVTMIGYVAGLFISCWQVSIGIAIATIWSTVAGMFTGMIWIECGKPKKKGRIK